MKNEFLATLHERAIALNSKIRTAIAPSPKSNSVTPNARLLPELESDSAKLVEFVAAEINRNPSSQEYEAQMLDTAPRPGETPEQTEQRVKAQNWDNPLVARSL